MVDLSEYFVIYQATNQPAVFCRTESHILSVISVKYMESRSHLSIRLIFITKLNTKTLIISTRQSKPNHFIIPGNHYRQVSPVFFPISKCLFNTQIPFLHNLSKFSKKFQMLNIIFIHVNHLLITPFPCLA